MNRLAPIWISPARSTPVTCHLSVEAKRRSEYPLLLWRRGPGRGGRFYRICFVAILVLATSAFADSILLTPVADAEIHQINSPDANYAFGSSIATGKLGANSGNEIRRAMLRFDPSGQLPPGAVVTAVSVTVNVVRVPGIAPANSTFDLRLILQSWTETNVTWNSRIQGSPWNSPGAEGAGDSLASPSSSVFVTGLGPYTFPSTPALLSDVQSWLNNPGTNFGWLLVSEDEVTSETARRFGAREDPPNASVLEIDYALPPFILTQPQDQNAFAGNTVTFTVDAGGTEPLSFQWLFGTNTITDATNQVLQLSNVTTNDSGLYSVVVSNPAGTTNSRQALLTVTNAPPGIPVVTITAPAAGANFPAFSDVAVAIDAHETNGAILRVNCDLLTNGNAVASASATNPPFGVIFSNLPPAAYVVTATATDTNLNTATSSAVPFTIRRPPTANLSLAPPGTNFILGATLTNTAIGSTDGGSANPVTNASFFDGSVLIGQAQPPLLQFNYTPTNTHLHSLSAVVYDSLGQAGTSAPVVIRISPVDHSPPSITLTSGPPNFSKVYSQVVTNAGKAADNDEVRSVQFQVMTGPFLATLVTNMTASGTSNWLGYVPLQPGNNFVRFRSVDFANNLSAPLDRYYNYVVTNQLSLQTNGIGSISPNLDGHWLNLGQIYTVTARPGLNQILAGWNGPGVNSGQPTLNFIMQPAMQITAYFIPNPFAANAGTYAGLFYDTNQPIYANSGAVNFQTTTAGSFSGRILLAGASYGFSGKFDPSGNTVLPVLRPGHVPLVLGLSMGLNPGDTRITGFVTNVIGTNKFVAELSAFRNVHNPRTNAAPQAGLHLFLLQSSVNDIIQSVGHGNIQVSTAGTALCQGELTPGPPFAFGNFLNTDGLCPFYLPLATGPAVILGWINLGDGSIPPPSTLYWLTTNPASAELLQAVFQ